MCPYISQEYRVANKIIIITESELPLRKNIKLVTNPMKACIPNIEVAD